jgi:hypothetical protein
MGKKRLLGFLSGLLLVALCGFAVSASRIRTLRPKGVINFLQNAIPDFGGFPNFNTTGIVDQLFERTKPTPATLRSGEDLVMMQKLGDELRASGAFVFESGGKIQQKHFPINPYLVYINQREARIFVFANSSLADEAAQGISPDGRTVNGIEVQYKDTPTYFKRDNIILLLMGIHEPSLKVLGEVLGEPITNPGDWQVPES